MICAYHKLMENGLGIRLTKKKVVNFENRNKTNQNPTATLVNNDHKIEDLIDHKK